MTTRILRQKGSGTLYAYTKPLALRDDMVLYDPEEAQIRIDAAKAKRDALDARLKGGAGLSVDPNMLNATDDAKQLNAIELEIAEKEEQLRREDLARDCMEKGGTMDEAFAIIRGEEVPKTEAETEEEKIQAVFDNDPDLKKIAVARKKSVLIDLIAEEYGKVFTEEDNTLESLKETASTLRKDRIMETLEI